MKKNKIKIVYTLLITTLLFTVACEEKDPNEFINDDKPLVVQGADFNFSVVKNTLIEGDILGKVSGVSNQGSVNFKLISQTPMDAMALDPSNGTLTVVNQDAFAVVTQVIGVAEVEKDGVTDNLDIVITVNETPPCSDHIFNINTWLGNLDVEDVGVGTNSGVGSGTIACNQLIISGDILNLDCDPNARITLTFTPASDGATNGTVSSTSQPFDCDGITDYSFVFPSGTYDESTGEILVNYEFYQDGSLNVDGQLLITSACTSTVNTGIWSGGINVEDAGFSTATAVGTPGCGVLTITGGDLLTTGCSNTQIINITLVPSAPDSTSGTVIALEQQYDCETGVDNTINFSGGCSCYDETTGEILLDYQYFQDGELQYPGTFIITPQ